MVPEFLLILALAAGAGGGGAGGGAPATSATAPEAMPEDQTPTGRFTTAGEVRPILTMTRNNWVHVREFDGADLVYLTHLLSWRCGLKQIEWRVNDGAWEVWPLPECHEDEPAPNAFKDADALPYVRLPLGSVETVGIRLIYDDLSADAGTFARTGMEVK